MTTETRTLGELCEFINGNGFTPRDWTSHGLPIIRIQNLNGSRDFNYFSGVPDSRWIVETGDLLFAWAGTRGVSFGIFDWRGPRGVLNQHILRVVPKPELDRDWVYYALRMVTDRVEQKAHGFKSSLLHVRRSDILDQTVEVPVPAEQRRLAKVLNLARRQIELAEHAVRAHERRRSAIVQQLLTGKRRLPGHGASWEETTFGDVFAEKQLRNVGSRVRTAITVGKYAIGRQSDKFNKSIASEDVSNYWIIEPGDFVYDPMSAYYGAIGRFDLAEPGIVSPAYRVQSLKTGFDSDFIKYVVKSHYVLFQLESYSSQNNQAGKRRLLQRDAFYDVSFPCPSPAEQRKIAAALQLADREIGLLRQTLDAYRRQTKGLMQQLLTGKRRVSDPAE